MPRRLSSLTIFDLIPFMDDGWLVYQPLRHIGDRTVGGYWELGCPEFEPKICGDYWDFHSGSHCFCALNISIPADWREAKYQIEKGKIIKGY